MDAEWLKEEDADAMIRLIVAGRHVVYNGHFDGADENGRTALAELDKALEPFAEAVPWDDQP